jgi:hypothetical protein
MSQASIEAALLEENRVRCAPPLPEAEVRQIARSASQYPVAMAGTPGAGSGTTSKVAAASRLIELAAGFELFHTPEAQAWATVRVGDHLETWEINSSRFRSLLGLEFYRSERRVPGSQAMQAALEILKGKALHEGPAVPVFTRLAVLGDSTYLDLVDDGWNAVEIARDGWRVIDHPPVKFRRPRGLLPLPVPARGGGLSGLRRLLNLADDADWELIVGWLVASLRPAGPYPILVLFGEQGSAKSTAARLLRSVLDPALPQLRSEPREKRDLFIAANNVRVLALDNLSFLPPWLSDGLCRLSTGGGDATRQLYTDSDEAIFDVQRPVILNGIEEPVTRADLLDRALLIQLPTIPEERRRLDADVRCELEAALPGILGGLLDVSADVMRQLPMTVLPRLPRMADFARCATAAEPSLGWPPGTFMRAYASNRETANDLALDSSPVVRWIIKLGERGAWTGTVGDLLRRLKDSADGGDWIDKTWPRSARALRAVLDRLRPNLRAAGVAVTFLGRGSDGRLVRVEKVGVRPSPPSRPSPDQASAWPPGPGWGESSDERGDDPRGAAKFDNPPSHRSPISGEAGDDRDGCDGHGPTPAPPGPRTQEGDDARPRPERPPQPFGTPGDPCAEPRPGGDGP